MYQPDRPIAEFIKWPEGRVEHALANLRASGEIKYAIQAGDTELESLAGEIKSRASRRCAELSKELEKDVGGRPSQKTIPISRKSFEDKSTILKSAGLTKSTAYRYEDLASVPIEKFEAYIDEKKEKKKDTWAG